jgi:hypothetical protein
VGCPTVKLGRTGTDLEKSMGRKGIWGGRELGADGSMGRTGDWGGRDSEHGADGSTGRTGDWGGRDSEHGADGSKGRFQGSTGRKGAWGGRPGTGVWGGRSRVWGGREAGADGRLGRTGAWGGRVLSPSSELGVRWNSGLLFCFKVVSGKPQSWVATPYRASSPPVQTHQLAA